MKVAVFGRFYNATTTFSVDTLFNYLKKRKIDAYIESEFYKLITIAILTKFIIYTINNLTL